MIVLNNNIYRTLDNKFYLGNTPIGKVYLGNILIYPEEQITIGGITIDISYHSLNGNMFDLGYAPTKNTRYELCFHAPKSLPNSLDIIGTQHDNKFINKYIYYNGADGTRGNIVGTSDSYTNYKVNIIDNNASSYSEIEKGGTDWNNLIANNTRGYKNYNNQTKFCVSLSTENNQKKFYFRYGGNQDSGSYGDTAISSMIVADKPYVIGFDDIAVGNSTDKRFYAGSGKLGQYYYKFNNLDIPKEVSYMVNNAISLNNSSIFNNDATISGGNIWLNAINARIANPNIQRPYDTINHTFDSDLIYYSNTSNMGFLYMFIWESGNNAKTLYTQHYDPNTSNVLIYKYIQVSDDKGGWKFRDADPNTGEVPVDEIIYPFYRCVPV